METLIGLAVGALATVLVARYYYRRSVNKSVGVYKLLNSFVFEGIAPDVRKQLNFRFKDKDVAELQQVVFLVANDGERAVSNIIEPLTLSIPADVEVLDASVLHRHPSALRLQVEIDTKPADESTLSFPFPILNKGEFFVVKLLLSGRLAVDKHSFRLLADDLPRSIQFKDLPPSAVEDDSYSFEWGLAVFALVVLAIPAWLVYFGYQLYGTRPELFPYPWPSFRFSFESFFLFLPGALILLIFTLLGASMLGAAAFGGQFPPRRGPRFPLPKELRQAVYRHPLFYRHGPFGELDLIAEGRVESPDTSNSALQQTARRRR